ncbi:SDR family NAD(P)-dependent oxidoreductase [Emcibacter nanhaiensis]|uniref:SDR family NAD(P)-dependent oxidoreductase n=1 Tax=Emcibacter nanhaiensis TaxID=1505037 RepID=A0A501PRT2_9PROT|nr:SDR family NAD(P)-dependent oxidoreductase [Emcibacter nanhaiensis]TPD62955.1 SDR family NAD(P)-dependent oxidoreductase [Emcibacter nanhaiensis]
MDNPKSILITGASSGIGEALALEYAAPGVTLFLSGRDPERTTAVAEACREKGAEADSRVIDVSNKDAMAGWIADCHRQRPLDLVIANAGIGLGFHKDVDLEKHTEEIFATNVSGVFHTVHPALELMRQQGGGQIAIMASLAAYHGMPSSPAYSTSKACVKAYGEALRGAYWSEGIEVNVICPGFVESRITRRNKFPMPFFMSAEKAARIIRKALRKNKARITFPWQTRLMFGGAVRLLPASLMDRFLRTLPDKT